MEANYRLELHIKNQKQNNMQPSVEIVHIMTNYHNGLHYI